MNQRTMVKVSAEETVFSIRTFSRERQLSRRFIFLQKELDILEEKQYVIASDIHSFAKMWLDTMDSGMQVVQIAFTWLQEAGAGKVSGTEETIRLPYKKLKECLEKSRNQNGACQRLLSVSENKKPEIEFRSRQNLKEIVKRKALRRKLGKFLSKQFCWYGTKKISITDAACPYSFFFTEDKENEKGICGGIILHGQEDLMTAYYGLHT